MAKSRCTSSRANVAIGASDNYVRARPPGAITRLCVACHSGRRMRMDWAVIGTARASPIVASPRRFQFAAEVLETNQRMCSLIYVMYSNARTVRVHNLRFL